MPGPSAAMKLPLIGVLSWLVPGAGHLAIGERHRGVIIFVTIAVTFWGGVAIGGVQTTVYPEKKRLWFMGQLCGGGHTLIANILGQSSRTKAIERQYSPGQLRSMSPIQQARAANELVATSRWSSAEIGTVYTGVAGLLNVLVILDVLVRADSRQQPGARRVRSPDAAGAT